MNILFTGLFDNKEATSTLAFLYDHDDLAKDEYKDIREFTISTIEESGSLTKIRNYLFNSETTEVYNTVKQLLEYISNNESEGNDNDIEIVITSLEIIATRYATIEDENIDKYSTTINSPSPSNLFFSISGNDENNRYSFFVAKIEKNDFLSKDDQSEQYQLNKGLPHKSEEQPKSSKNWKTATIEFLINENKEMEFDELILADSSSTIAKYWSTEFLETKELNDDEYNTENAYKLIKRVINSLSSRDITAKPDSMHFLNQLNGYMLNNNTFTLEEMKTQVFGDSYSPVSENVKVDEIIQRIDKLVAENKFDAHFNIDKGIINTRTKDTVKVSDNIDIRISKSINNLKDTIYSGVDENGEYFIKIIVEDEMSPAYQQFNFNKEE